MDTENINRLTKIADSCLTDKGSVQGEKHMYTEFYDRYFSRYIGKHPVILEIGILNGASLKMYNEYFDGDCEIYAIDIEDKSEYNADNIHTYVVDQSDRHSLEVFKKKLGISFDIVIDDGSHKSIHQWVSLAYLHDIVKPGGIYIIEDLHTNMYAHYNNNDPLHTPLHCLAFKQPTKYLTYEENKAVMDSIDTVTIWCYNNPSIVLNQSITSILTFKN